LAALLVFLGWKSLVDLHAAASPIQPVAAVQSPSVSREISTDDIADAHLFGRVEMTDGSHAATPPPSSWHVIGIIVGDSPQESMADIVIDGAEHLWRVGDQLPDGSTLAAIDTDGIKTSGGGAALPFELRPASYDNDLSALSLQANTGKDVDTTVATPTARPDMAIGLPNRMSALRTAGIAVWIKRIQQTPHRAVPAKPAHH
jgi:hypothetical protein